MNSPVPIVVVGAGVMGRLHARVLSELKGATLVGIIDSDPVRAQEIATKHDVAVLQDLAEAWERGARAVVIAVPTSEHFRLAQEAFERGFDCLIEKPIAATVSEAQQLIALASARQKVLSVGHIERFNPVVQYLHNALKDEQIVSISVSRVGPLPPQVKDVGVVIDLAVHDIDMVRYLSRQEVVELFCIASSNLTAHDDFGSLLLRLSDGVGASVNVSWISPFKSREIQVVTRNRIFQGNLLTKTIREFSRHPALAQHFISREIVTEFQEPLRLELTGFLDAVRTRGTPPVTGEDGLAALLVASRAVEQSKATLGSRVTTIIETEGELFRPGAHLAPSGGDLVSPIAPRGGVSPARSLT